MSHILLRHVTHADADIDGDGVLNIEEFEDTVKKMISTVRESEPEVHCNTLQHAATHCNTLRHAVTHCNTLQHAATRWHTLQHSATHCNVLQDTATRCNTL